MLVRCSTHAHSIMDRRLRRAVVAMLLMLPYTYSHFLHAQQPWFDDSSARVRFDGHARESVWRFPIKYKWIPAVAKRTSATRVNPHVYPRQLLPIALSTRDSSGGFVRESVWSFPYKYDRIPVVAKRTLQTGISDPCSVDEAAQEMRRSRRDDCKGASATPIATTQVPSYRCVLESKALFFISAVVCFLTASF